MRDLAQLYAFQVAEVMKEQVRERMERHLMSVAKLGEEHLEGVRQRIRNSEQALATLRATERSLEAEAPNQRDVYESKLRKYDDLVQSIEAFRVRLRSSRPLATAQGKSA